MRIGILLLSLWFAPLVTADEPATAQQEERIKTLMALGQAAGECLVLQRALLYYERTPGASAAFLVGFASEEAKRQDMSADDLFKNCKVRVDLYNEVVSR